MHSLRNIKYIQYFFFKCNVCWQGYHNGSRLLDVCWTSAGRLLDVCWTGGQASAGLGAGLILAPAGLGAALGWASAERLLAWAGRLLPGSHRDVVAHGIRAPQQCPQKGAVMPSLPNPAMQSEALVIGFQACSAWRCLPIFKPAGSPFDTIMGQRSLLSDSLSAWKFCTYVLACSGCWSI